MSLSWLDARAVASTSVRVLPPRTVALEDSIGRVLAADVIARQDIPHYASSAMDGWAVAGDGPWRVVGGDLLLLDGGEATVVVTGGVLPSGTLGVLRQEFGRVEHGILHRSPDAKSGEPGPGTHLRPTGAEARQGEVLIARGTLLNPAHAAVAAVAGADEVLVTGRPAVRLLLTGDEVDERGLPPAGRVRDTHGPQLPTILRMLGADRVTRERVRDTLPATVAALSGCPEELVVVTGGTGRSDADHVRAALLALGADILIDGVAMRPGGPTMLARLADGRMVVALAGNPLAAFVGLMTVGAPVIASLVGAPSAQPRAVFVASGEAGHPGITTVAPCVATDGIATITAWRGSGMMRGLADATALLITLPQEQGSGNALALALPWVTT